jgi:hypothetical protein
MNRAILTTAFVTSFVCAMSLACSPSADAPPQAQADAAPLVVEAAEPSSSAALQTPASSLEQPTPVIDEPVLASTTVLPAERKAETPDNLPLSNLPNKGDKPPVAGVGASGIHLDELAVGKGWASSRCEQLGARFEVETDDRVNVCFRVVHPRVAETVTVEWARAGKLRQSIEVNVRSTRAYLTRAWLPVSAGRVGEWTATVKADDGSVLGRVEFEIVD